MLLSVLEFPFVALLRLRKLKHTFAMACVCFKASLINIAIGVNETPLSAAHTILPRTLEFFAVWPFGKPFSVLLVCLPLSAIVETVTKYTLTFSLTLASYQFAAVNGSIWQLITCTTLNKFLRCRTLLERWKVWHILLLLLVLS
jgi:hypothetical protein